MSYTIWFTGLSGSGKTTIAEGLVRRLRRENISVVLLDGDEVRKTLSADLGYTKEQRDKHITRVANMCYLITKNNVLNVACVISPTKKIRRYASGLIGDKFIEVYVKCPLSRCEERDVKGLYSKARKEHIDFVGINVPYEEPEQPDIVLFTDIEKPDESVNKLYYFIKEKVENDKFFD